MQLIIVGRVFHEAMDVARPAQCQMVGMPGLSSRLGALTYNMVKQKVV